MLRPDSGAMTLLLGALVAIAPLTMDIYLPSLPSMTQALGATVGEVQLTVSVYMFGWGVAQLFAGPVSDRFGRRPAFLWALAAYVAASAVCALAQDAGTLVAARFVQALSMATVAVVPRAVVRDLHAGERAAQMLSTMMLVLGVAPVLAPILGAELHVRFGWRATFVFVALYGVAAWLAVRFGLPETLRRRDPTALDPGTMVGNWRRVLSSRRYVGFMLTIAGAWSGLFAFLAGSAFVFVDAMGESERAFSLYLALVSLGVFAGTAVSRRALPRIGLERLIGASTAVLFAAGATMAALAWIGTREPLAVALPMFVFMAAYMGSVPQSTAGALTPYPEIAGSAASLMSFVQFSIAATVAFVVGLAFDGTARPMASAIGLAGALAFVAFRTLVRPAPQPTPGR
jgi:DHA1 family bicyclomycin/chloramphenicol resistance-like MFS transporter